VTKQETVRILATLEAHAPLQFEKISNATKENMLRLWASRFEKDDYKIVAQAVVNYIDNDTKGFLPSIGAIKDEVRKILFPNELTEQEAVNMILDKLNWRSAKEAYESLPPILQKVVGSHSQLVSWGYIDTDTVQSVISSNIQRSLRSLLEREREKQRTGQVPVITEKLLESKPVSEHKPMNIISHPVGTPHSEGQTSSTKDDYIYTINARTDEEQKAINLEGVKKAMEALRHG
jgi:hypothetical protein